MGKITCYETPVFPFSVISSLLICNFSVMLLQKGIHVRYDNYCEVYMDILQEFEKSLDAIYSSFCHSI